MIWFDLSLENTHLWVIDVREHPRRFSARPSTEFIEWAERYNITSYEFRSDASQKIFVVTVGFASEAHAMLFKLRWL